MFKKICIYAATIIITAAIAVPYGQFARPIPLEPRSALPSYSGDGLPVAFDDSGFEMGYSDEYRAHMDKLVASSIKPAH